MVDETTLRGNSYHVMNAITFPYTDFSSSALIAIFKLADLLGVTPTRACEIYLAEMAKRTSEDQSAA